MSDLDEKVSAALESAYASASKYYDAKQGREAFGLSEPFLDALESMSERATSASSGFTNLVTSMALKAAFPEIDSRYHQVQIQKPRFVAFRPVSEKVIYPWLREKNFDYAKSGWQTRTFERPKPYMLDYDENIGIIKVPFLTCYDCIEDKGQSAQDGLAYLFLLQMRKRDEKRVELVEPKIDDISMICSFFEQHFSHSYKARGTSRLPVLAIFALYKVVIPELKRFSGFELKNLELHSAADSQTGAVGDIELADKGGDVFEAVEIKHNIPLSVELINDTAAKLVTRNISRFYILTTSSNCTPTDEMNRRIKEMRDRTGCQIIANGVIPTIRYYLRLVENPSSIFRPYLDLVRTDKGLSHEHREQWNRIVLQN